MSDTKTNSLMLRAGVVGAAVAVTVFAACSGEGPPRPRCSDVSVSDAGIDVDPYTLVPSDAAPPEAFGQESDPGPTCTDCTLDRNVEVMTVVDFENGFAPAWYNYGEPGIWLEPPAAGPAIDGTTTNDVPPPYWGLQVAALTDKPGGERCGSEYALHMAGGRFSSWGGGFVTRLLVVRGELIDQYCEPGKAETRDNSLAGRIDKKNGIGGAPRYMTNGTVSGETVTRDSASGCFFYISPGAEQPSLLGFDVADYDGISFWARRGPSGQSTLRVALVDDATSADLNLQQEREYWVDKFHEAGDNPDIVVDPDEADTTCRRVKSCCRHCYEELHYQEYVDASRAADGVAYFRPRVADRCWVPGEPMAEFRTDETGTIRAWDFRLPDCGLVPTTEDLSNACWTTDVQNLWDQWNRDYGLCCPRTMKEELEDPVEANGDPRYGGKPCLPYIFNFDQSSGNYCADPGEVLPEKNQNRCDEGFESSIVVGPEWKLYTIPWRELRRFTPDKPPVNSGSIWMISFYFSSGYLDTYVDDVGFYRNRSNR